MTRFSDFEFNLKKMENTDNKRLFFFLHHNDLKLLSNKHIQSAFIEEEGGHSTALCVSA